jgi:hypothetical protein|tara:strand:- start:2742 stop:3362 length:621 start_codon:yes stop_codon:yes gene_type:complete
MALTTYDELKASIADFLNRSDLTSVIPDFITLAETKLNREVRHWRMEKRSTATLDTQYSSLPDDFLEPIRMSLTSGDTHTLEMVNAFQISNLRASNLDTIGRPTSFAILDGSIEVFPTPDASYTLELLYYQKIDVLNSSNASNWVLTNHPDAYLYGSLIHSAPYLAEDNRIQTWAALYKSAIDAISMESERSKTSGSGRRMKIRSY